MQTFGPNSVSSGLAVALKIAYVLVAVWAAVTVAGAVLSLAIFILFTAQSHEPPASLKSLVMIWTVGVPAVLYRLTFAVGAIAVVRRLRSLFDSLAANQPFAAGNAEHLRRIWVTLVVIEIVRICAFVAARLLPTLYTAGDVSPLPQEIASPVDLSRWFLIFVVLILAEVFRQGTRLREDSELTV
jgi:Protein of unknown function (DUF2975)